MDNSPTLTQPNKLTHALCTDTVMIKDQSPAKESKWSPIKKITQDAKNKLNYLPSPMLDKTITSLPPENSPTSQRNHRILDSPSKSVLSSPSKRSLGSCSPLKNSHFTHSPAKLQTLKIHEIFPQPNTPVTDPLHNASIHTHKQSSSDSNIYRKNTNEEPILHKYNPHAQPGKPVLKKPSPQKEATVSIEGPETAECNTTIDDMNSETQPKPDSDKKRVKFDLPDYVPADDNSRIIYIRTQRMQIKQRKIIDSLRARKNKNSNSPDQPLGMPHRTLVPPPTPIRTLHRKPEMSNHRLNSTVLSRQRVLAKNKTEQSNGLLMHPVRQYARSYLNPRKSLIPRAVFQAVVSGQSKTDNESPSEDQDSTSGTEGSEDEQLIDNTASEQLATRAVGYACSIKLIKSADKLPSNIGRATLVHTLIYAYKLFKPLKKGPDPFTEPEDQQPQCQLIPVTPLTREELVQYHDKEYIDFLFYLDEKGGEINSDDEEADENEEEKDPFYDFGESSFDSPNLKRKAAVAHYSQLKRKAFNGTRHIIPASMQTSLPRSDGFKRITTKLHKKYERFGIEYDCPYFEGVSEYVQQMTGASIACADYILAKFQEQQEHLATPLSTPLLAPAAINWQGGRHHARKSQAAGFCYANDVVLCIQRLRTHFNKVLYLDLDLHHGDGVETAFTRSSKVAVVSVHRYGAGFYPGTKNGSLEYQGGGTKGSFATAPGVGYTLNIPTLRGFGGHSLRRVFDEIIDPYARRVFKPDCVVVTLGCDGLSRDEHREWNLTVGDYETVVREYVLEKWNLPTVFLGGGGYHHTDAARCWTYLTASILGRSDQYHWEDIPEHSLLNSYKEDAFQFQIPQNVGGLEDLNKGEYLDNVVNTLRERYPEMNQE